MANCTLIASIFIFLLAASQAPADEPIFSPCELMTEIDGAFCDVLELHIGDAADPVLRLRFASDQAEREAVMLTGKAVTDWCIKSRDRGIKVPRILRVQEARRRIELGTCDEQPQVEPAA
jgi:hypothetical protein